MIRSGELRVVFRVAAGPRRGFGHLVRCLSFARAMGVRPLLSIKGADDVVHTALTLGGDVLADVSPRVLGRMRPDVVVIDDPIASTARQWIAAARRAGALVVTIHDLGLGCVDADVVIDGSVTRQARAAKGRVALTGAQFAILDPTLPRRGRRREAAGRRNVLVALGGGKRRVTALAVAEAIAAADPRARIRIAGGFMEDALTSSDRITWIGASRGLGKELERATVAVVGGGVSLYEACAVGVPTVTVPVVPAQAPTVRAFARHGAAVAMPFKVSGARAAAEVVALLDDPRRRAMMARRSKQLVDGQGASRAAAAVLSFVERRRS
jgi:spore coat polysaccharide biosynthesis predicted glycosyltransferase SpsG